MIEVNERILIKIYLTSWKHWFKIFIWGPKKALRTGPPCHLTGYNRLTRYNYARFRRLPMGVPQLLDCLTDLCKIAYSITDFGWNIIFHHIFMFWCLSSWSIQLSFKPPFSFAAWSRIGKEALEDPEPYLLPKESTDPFWSKIPNFFSIVSLVFCLPSPSVSCPQR